MLIDINVRVLKPEGLACCACVTSASLHASPVWVRHLQHAELRLGPSFSRTCCECLVGNAPHTGGACATCFCLYNVRDAAMIVPGRDDEMCLAAGLFKLAEMVGSAFCPKVWMIDDAQVRLSWL